MENPNNNHQTPFTKKKSAQDTKDHIKMPFKTFKGLGHWNYYFILKFILYFKEYIGFSAFSNLAFAAFILVPIKQKLVDQLRKIIAIPAGIVIFYSDSWLPPFSRIVDEFDNLTGFSFGYLFELLQRMVNFEMIAAAFVLWVAYLYVQQWFRISVFVVCSLIILSTGVFTRQVVELPSNNQPMIANQTGEQLDPTLGPSQALNEFYQQEQQRKVIFPAQLDYEPEYDILIMNICSLAWSDLSFTGMQQHALFSEFDILFSNFNSAASYSGPAAIRLLKASCGQKDHLALYKEDPEDCYLFQDLARLGFEQQMVLNHNGQFDDFIELLQNRGKINAIPQSTERLPIVQRAFDSSPIYDDLATLNRWLDTRQNEASTPTATYYNSVSLHDGNLFTGDKATLNSLENFHPRMTQLLNNLQAFFNQLENSGRKVIVVMVPEHGAAAEGDKLQISGLRDIPSPSITRVPVGIRIFGDDSKRPSQSIVISKPSTHLAISHFINELVQSRPFGSNQIDWRSIAQSSPATSFVAENEGTVLIQHNGQYLMKYKRGDWMKYPTKN
jgi:cellulose synthase operon protein YhjU